MARLVALLTALVLVAACTGGDPAPSPTTDAPATALTTTTILPITTLEGSAPTDTTLTTDALDDRLAWLIAAFEAGDLDEAEYDANFTAEFIANVAYADFAEVIAQVGETGDGWQVAEFEQRDEFDATLLIAPTEVNRAIRAEISLETLLPHRIQGLFIQPAEPPTLENPPADFETAEDRLSSFGETSLLVAEVTEGACAPVFEIGSGDAVAVGSAAKLYVLGAVADAVEAGELSWGDDVAISEELKSVPSGVLQDEEAGTTFSVREMAEAMIALSDNTATDHLIDLVGRQAVESAQGANGMADPALNIPFLTTLELAALKVGPAAGLATQWLDADEAGRRAILDQVSDIVPADLPVAEFVDPVFPDQIEWFATPADMCRALVGLYDRGDPLDKILTINPGLPDEAGVFDVIAFKGGSEPGLVAMNWLVHRPDGRRFVVAGSVVDPDEAFDQLEVILLFGAVRDLVADL